MNLNFGSIAFKSGEEERWKKSFDLKMSPREWIARFGHNIMCGDLRMYIYTDTEFEKWIHVAFEALTNEGLEKLWDEYLTKEEIEEIKAIMNDV